MIQQILSARARRNRIFAGIFAAVPIVVLLAAGVRASREWAGPFPIQILESARGYFQDEAARAGKSAQSWAALGLTATAVAAADWLGMMGPPSAVTYAACVLAVAGGGGVMQEAARRRHYSGISGLLASEVAPASADYFWLKREVADLVRSDLQGMRDSLDARARTGLRAGCVIPVLFSGIALYGLSAGTAQGEDLAGLAIGAALVMAAPSMLRYWSLKTRLARVDGLINLWDRNLPTMERANE